MSYRTRCVDMDCIAVKNSSSRRPGCSGMTGWKPVPPRSGFTLVEILIVIAIIAVLVALMVGVTKEMIKQAKIKETSAKLGVLYNLIDQYKGAMKKFPDVGSTDDLVTQLNRLHNIDVASLVGKEFYGGGSVCDSWKKEIKYGKATVSESITTGSDGKPEKTIIYAFSISCGGSASSQMQEVYRMNDSGDWMLITTSPAGNTDNRYVDRWLSSNHMPVLVSAGPDEEYDTSDDIILPLNNSK